MTELLFPQNFFSQEASLPGFNLYISSEDFTRKLIQNFSVIDVETDEMKPVKNNQIGLTYGVNPCFAYVAVKKDFMFLGHRPHMTDSDQQIIKATKNGVAFVNSETQPAEMELFAKNGFYVIQTREGLEGYEIAVVRKSIPNVPVGVIYSRSYVAP